MKKIFPIKSDNVDNESPASNKNLLDLHKEFNDPYLPEDKHVATVKSMLKYASPNSRSKLSTVNIENVTRKTHIAFVLMPKWAIYFAPYNIARLTAVTRSAGYRTSVFDWNIETWHALKNLENFDMDPYQGGGATDYLWLDSMYDQHLKDKIEPMLETYLAKLIETKPDVVGFSLYYTNIKTTTWLARQLKKHLPNVIIIGGGSHIQWDPAPFPEFDHVVKGEGEEVLLELLNKIEKGEKISQYQFDADTSKRLNLDTLPMPDYSDFEINEYLMPNAFSSEFSRGCVAKCTFCAETHYWKYRGRQGPMVLDEIEFQHKNFGIDFFWFIDSLVNGNINELRAFALGVIDRGLKIRWTGYARCDSRMDYEYYKDLRESGCDNLNYGVESGSNKVLNDMRKNITAEEVEQNFKDGYSNDVHAATNWMLGYVTERSTDFARTLILFWRIQKCLINASRQTMLIGPSRVRDDPDKFGVHNKWFLNAWASKDLENTKIHRLIRLKSFNIFIDNCPNFYAADEDPRKTIRQSYSISNNLTEFNHDLPYEDFDYEIIKDTQLDSSFARSLVNEIWPLFRTLWRARNYSSFDMSVTFDPEWDRNNYGDRLSYEKFSALYNFSINQQGEWKLNCCVKFIGPDNIYAPWQPDPGEQTNFDIDLTWSGSGTWDLV